MLNSRRWARRSQAKRSTKVRWDIQGLRAFAVLVVVINHLTGWPRGGFVGVDVFFVISGFLITGLLVREHDKTGTLSWQSFYRRRAKRILPASLVVIAATVLGSLWVFPANRAHAVNVDAVWALFFSINWEFAFQATDYFSQDRAISPLQHYWSLGIEEQFYFVWPWLMLLILALHARRRGPSSGSHVAAGVTMAVIVAASFGWALVQSQSDANRAYFSTFTRVWELGVGALLAIAAPLLMRIPDHLRTALAWIGLAGMVASLWLVDPDAFFPAPWAALPVLSSGLVIAAGTFRDYREQQRWLWPLTNRVSNWVGDLSYSLYLWHFPIIILLAALIEPDTAYYYFAAVVLMAALSITSYYLIEDPIRRSDWLIPGRKRIGPSGTVRAYRAMPAAQYSALGLLFALTLVLIPAAFNNGKIDEDAVSSQFAASGLASETPAPETVALPLQADLQSQLRESLSTPEIPKLEPGVEKLTTQQWIDGLTAGVGCSDVSAKNVDKCIFGPPAARTAVVIGDSFAMAWMPAIREALAPNGYRVQQLTRGECPVWNVPITHVDGKPFPECAEQLQWDLAQARKLEPDLVILANSVTGVDRVTPAATGGDVEGQITEGMTGTLNKLNESNPRRVIVLSAPPTGKPLQQCVTRTATADDCVSRISQAWRSVTEAEAAAVTAAGVGDYIDTSQWFCVDGYCPGWAGSTPIRADDGHMTLQYSKSLGPVLWEALTAKPAAS